MNKKLVAGGAVTLAALLVGGTGYWWYANKTPDAAHRRVVGAFLKDPESAQFRNTFPSKRDPTVWCGEVNARSGMGNMVGYRRYVISVPDGDWPTEPSYEQRQLITVLARLSLEDDADGFSNRWQMYCTP